MDTKELIANVQKIEIRTRKIVNELTAGAYHSVFKGSGMEFEEVREYMAGDDVRSIDWNVTARMGSAFIKKFVEERELTVFILVDISGSGDFGSTEKSKNEYAAELAALLAFSAIRNKDRVGLMLFSNHDELLLPPQKGRKHVLRCVRELLVHERSEKSTSIKNALEKFMKFNKRKAVVFLISDFLDKNFEQALTVANKRHDVIAMRIGDPLEVEFPKSPYIAMEDPETGEYGYFAGLFKSRRNSLKNNFSEQTDYVNESCRKAGVDLISLNNGDDYVKPLMNFFKKREGRKSR